METIKIKIIPLLYQIEVKNLSIIYTEGIGSIKNSMKNCLIEKAIEVINENFFLEKKIYIHNKSTSCLKFIKNSSKQIEILTNNIINHGANIINNALKKFSNKIKNYNNLFQESIFREENIIFYFDSNAMDNLSKKFNFIMK